MSFKILKEQAGTWLDNKQYKYRHLAEREIAKEKARTGDDVSMVVVEVTNDKQEESV